MTELEKMRSGLPYNLFDAELDAIRLHVYPILQRFNQGASAHDGIELLLEMGMDIHPTALIQPPLRTCYARFIKIGAKSFINWDCVMLDHGGITIGEHVFIGPQVQLVTVNHASSAKERIAGGEIAKPINIADKVWIGSGAIILPGISIAEGAIVAAGAVVTKNVAAYTTVGGNPAKVIATTTE
ncbi:sugar O-acetyltransferase [Ferrimonas lipolytica]|uniref:Sugar O-acetyltransferase n=1 Tax=Ferrimonas lipolytica TaxID=2724191 RepID=A0A6H1UJV6_9GAMM|nr:sugar O-acetyltransferase [Ferrimonas lipolytica]QIZ78890.1 sugar O-acetyltransferase [Ferrimonas lipolytica]